MGGTGRGLCPQALGRSECPVTQHRVRGAMGRVGILCLFPQTLLWASVSPSRMVRQIPGHSM